MTKKILWGIFFIGAAALILANQMGYFAADSVGLFSLVLTLIMVPVIIESIVHLNFFGIMFPLAFISIIYAKQLGIEKITPWPVLIAALFISIGFSILFKHKKDHKWFHHKENHVHYIGHKHSFDKNRESVDYLEDNVVNCSVSFGSSSKYLHSASLERAVLTCSFGSLQVYFDNTVLSPNGAEIKLDCSLGSIEMYIPKNWKVIDHVNVSLGELEEKNRPGETSGPALTLVGSVSLGSVEIIYI